MFITHLRTRIVTSVRAEKVLDRGEKIEVLVDQTDRLQTKSYGLQSKAKSLKRYAREGAQQELLLTRKNTPAGT